MSNCCDNAMEPPPKRGTGNGASPGGAKHFTLALVGNPNAGKTTLFNALTGLRAKTANFPGTTVERKIGRMEIGGEPVSVVDLPGLYSLDGLSPEEKVAADALRGVGNSAPDGALVVVDAKAEQSPITLDPLPAGAAAKPQAVGIVADKAGRIAIAFRDGRIAVKDRGTWSTSGVSDPLPAARPGSPPATSP